jgi:hypothetical protein
VYSIIHSSIVTGYGSAPPGEGLLQMAPEGGPEEFRERAAECERLAAETKNPHYRETLLYVASRWRAIAGEDERRWHPRELETISG